MLPAATTDDENDGDDNDNDVGGDDNDVDHNNDHDGKNKERISMHTEHAVMRSRNDNAKYINGWPDGRKTATREN